MTFLIRVMLTGGLVYGYAHVIHVLLEKGVNRLMYMLSMSV